MKRKERSRTLTAFNLYRARLRWANERPEIWQDGCQWYPNAFDRINTVAHETRFSTFRIAGVVSLLSPLTPWKRNLRGGIELARLAANGAPEWQLQTVAERSTVYNTNAKRAVRYIQRDESAEPGGMKTGPFQQNLAGNLSPVTVDSWMTRIVGNFGLSSATPTENANRAITRAVEMCATLYGIAPAQAQAIVWTVERDYWNEETANRA